MKSAILAVQFMTRLPLPSIAAAKEDFAAAIRWFPLAGMVVGAGVAAAGWLGALRDPALGALLALVAWVGLTGALHLDGLGDIADAAGAAHGDPKRMREVLADPHLGSFGVTAIALQLLAKGVLIWLILRGGAFGALALAPVLARIGPLAWARWLRPLHEGFGTLFRGGASLPVLVTWLLAWACCALAVGPMLLAALPALALWPLWLRARIGGISGDGHGAGIELVESCALLALVMAR
ncbi:adenosylcobinamide-GDP ribazoletransferase [Sphingobium amiense]|uniref:Adenosylcobinamide-GDP ribazoletransferase n=1 Tax=Sphingobium amiense TaxID=135719 RepID=A0A494WF36_9SPHN|nr:adenosylcobinamide-GDP ribazoletransferase [Sphingobium amiense]BBD99169.1 adenosylcobinamide-GDP ribazoletransferase [Sphingobium amiense]